MASGLNTSWQINGETMETVTDFVFLGSRITADGECSHKIKALAPWKKSYDQPRQYIKKHRHYIADKGLYSQNYGFSSSHVWMWELDYKESWAPKNWCFWTVVLEKTLESPLVIKPVNLKGNQPWIFIGRTDAEPEAPIFLPPVEKSRLIEKVLDARNDWRQEKGTTEDEMVGRHHQLNGPEFEPALGHGEGQGSLVCCSPWSHKESDTTEWLNNNKDTRTPEPALPGTIPITAASVSGTFSYHGYVCLFLSLYRWNY